MEKAKTIREVRDFLNAVPEEFLERTFVIQEENDLHYVHFLEVNTEDEYYDPEQTDDAGNMTLKDWEEHYPETDIATLVVGIPKGCPVMTEEF